MKKKYSPYNKHCGMDIAVQNIDKNINNGVSQMKNGIYNATLIVLMGIFVMSAQPGCGQGQKEIKPASEQNYLGAADGFGDEPDFQCQVVLRNVSRVPNGPGYTTTCDLVTSTDEYCRYIWNGEIDVDARTVSELQGVFVLFRTSETGEDWYQVQAQPEGEPADGFARYSFTIDQFTPNPGMSMTSLNRTTIDLIPFVLRNSSIRVFDHNRISNPLGSYHLDYDNLWSLDDEPGVCAPLAERIPVWHFYSGWYDNLENGPVVSGGSVKIDYDGKRLRESQDCLGSQAAVSSTTIYASWSIDGGAVHTAQVENYIESYGYACQGQEPPCITNDKDQPVIEIPAGSDDLQMWFYCKPGFSQGSEANWKYDSNMGDNYHQQIVQTANPVNWAGAWQHYASRSGFVFDLPDPIEYHGFSNMGWAVQAQVYVKGKTDQHQVDDHLVKAYVESDVFGCEPGGDMEIHEISLVATHQGDFGNNSLYRWGYEGSLYRCGVEGTYHYRFLFSADGGLTKTPLGAAEDIDQPSAGMFRTIEYSYQ